MFTLASFVVGLAAIQAAFGVSVTNLHARQSDTLPLIPSTGIGPCHDACASYQNQSQVCGTGTPTQQNKNDPASCMCNSNYMNSFVTCYDCILPLVQQAGTDPQFQDHIQNLLSELEDSCKSELHPVPSLTITPDFAAAGVTPTGGATSPNGGHNAAVTAGAISYGVLVGFVGVALVALAA